MRDEWIGLAAAAAQLHLGWWGTRSLILRGELVGKQDGLSGRWLVHRASLDSYARRHPPRREY